MVVYSGIPPAERSENLENPQEKCKGRTPRGGERMELSEVVEKAWLFTAAHQLRGGGGGFPYQRFLWLVYTVYKTIMLLRVLHDKIYSRTIKFVISCKAKLANQHPAFKNIVLHYS
jgi:hypothetical protein